MLTISGLAGATDAHVIMGMSQMERKRVFVGWGVTGELIADVAGDRESGLEISASYDEDDIEPVAESDDLDEMDEPTCNFCSHYKDTPWCVDCEDKCHMCVHKAVCRFTNEFFGERKICRNFFKGMS